MAPTRIAHLSSVLLLVALQLPNTAEAQLPTLDRTFSPQLFHPAVGPDEFLMVQPAAPLPHLNFSVGLWFNYARESFTIFTVEGNGVGSKRSQLIQNTLGADLVLALGLFDRLQIGLGIPATLFQNGENFDYSLNGAPQPTIKAPNGFALGDPWLDVKLRFFGKERGIQFGANVMVTAPLSLATPDSFGGDSSLSVGGHLLGGWEGERFRIALQVGFVGRVHQSHFFSTTFGHQLLYGVAASVDLLDQRRLTLVGELYGRADVSGSAVNNIDANPLEIRVAGKARLARPLYLSLGLGVGLVKGVGSPAARVILGLTFAPDRRDRDHDGIPDIDDKCADTPEDKDGFQDSDGCPDLDNDGDGIPDARDKCPNDPEDFDQFQDEDGCPDPDNDQDGVPDKNDLCPNDKEDRKPPKPKDGCPLEKTDTDGDGIPDHLDKCPEQPEDKDGFQDEDGCPDPDNDQDGYADAQDKCPNEPEDFDQFEDEDGCPEPDNDHDGILDKDDKCPNEPETINGYQDEDGCPDKGPASKVQLVGDELIILEKVFFDTAKATIKKQSFNLLDQVASTIKAHREIKKMRIEGHTDSRGSIDKNRKLSQDRAQSVVTYLVKKGLPAERFEAKGFGPDKAVADNRTKKGQEANRRVEFHITEREAIKSPNQEQPEKP